MKNQRYILEPYKGRNTRYTCPSCGAKNEFARYMDIETGEHLPIDFGRCNRESKCGYHKQPPIETKCLFVPFQKIIDHSPKAYQITTSTGLHYLPKSMVFEVLTGGCYVSDYILTNPRPGDAVPKFDEADCRYYTSANAYTTATLKPINQPQKEASKVAPELFKKSLSGYDENNFVAYLISQFGTSTTEQAIARYFVGTSKHWPGATVFWQIDISGQIRAGKIMQYNRETGRRVKEPRNLITWVHKVLKQHDFNLSQCFFGEHLLRDNQKPVGIVESEKTAIIASVYLPGFVWLAAGSLEGLNPEKCTVLRGRQVVLFPDLRAVDKWHSKAEKLYNITAFKVSDLLDKKATEAERTEGFDLADYLLRLPVADFQPEQKSNEPADIFDHLPRVAYTTKEPLNPIEQTFIINLCEPQPFNYAPFVGKIISENGQRYHINQPYKNYFLKIPMP